MHIFNKIKDLQSHLYTLSNLKIGFVPTMGALHNGHLNLVEKAKLASNLVVVSIFVNPLQFNNTTDFEKYPITLENDLEALRLAKCDVVFVPTAAEMYKQATTLKFDFGPLETLMEGKFRPGHFNGVGVVVAKLFHIVKPNLVFFGQKDYQQCAVIKTLITDLSFDLEMVIVPTVRDHSGLALSSRNMRLSDAGKMQASHIFKTLQLGKTLIEQTKSIVNTKQEMLQFLSQVSTIELEYLEVADTITLESCLEFNKDLVICFAGFLEGVRLIDNIVIKFVNV